MPTNGSTKVPKISTVKAIVDLKKVYSASITSQSPRSLDTQQQQLVINTIPEVGVDTDTFNEKAVTNYIEDRTITENDDELLKLKKISLCRLDIGPQAKNFIRYFSSVGQNQVPQTIKIYSVRPEHGQSRADFIMGNLAIGHMNDSELKQVRKWINDFQFQFYVEGDALARTDIAMHDIYLKPGTGVINVKQFTLPKAMKDGIVKQMRSLREQGVVKDSVSPFNSPTFAVPKKDEFGGKTNSRTVHDYKKLNGNTIVQSYPIPIVWDLIDQFENCEYFSVLDIKSAYHQIPMNPEHSYLTAFTVDYWKYEYDRMPMGLAGAPATMQAGITNALEDVLNKGVTVYLDDISVATPTRHDTWNIHKMSTSQFTSSH